MENNERVSKMAARYDLQPEFCQKLFDKCTDKSYFERAVRMFVDGRLKYSDATSEDMLDIAAIRQEVAQNFRKLHKERVEAIRKRKELAEYYEKCERYALIVNKRQPNESLELAYVDNGRLVAFAHFDSQNRGMIAANNKLESYNWERLHDILLRLRSINKAFVRQLKHHCYNESSETFRFDERTVRNK